MKGIHSINKILSKEEAGFILPHEHLSWDQSFWAEPEPPDEKGKVRYHEKVSLWNRSEVMMHPFCFIDDLKLNSFEEIFDDVMEFKKAGGGTIVEVSPRQFGRNIDLIYELSVKCGINIVFGSSNYTEAFWSDSEKKRTVEDIKKEIINEFENGVGVNRLKPGIIGEVGLNSVQNENERKSLIASVLAQKELGCPVSIHPPLFSAKGKAYEGHEVLDIVEEYGGDVSKTILSHTDFYINTPDYIDSLAKRGCFIEFDQLGMHYMSFTHRPGNYLVCDLERVLAIKEQIDRGNKDKLLLSQDVCYKHLLKKWGGFGYSHILVNIMSMLQHYGKVDEAIVHEILFSNPFKALSW